MRKVVMNSSAESLRVWILVPVGCVCIYRAGGKATRKIENRLRRIDGVESMQTNPLTGNVLIHFDPRTIDEKTLLAELDET